MIVSLTRICQVVRYVRSVSYKPCAALSGYLSGGEFLLRAPCWNLSGCLSGYSLRAGICQVVCRVRSLSYTARTTTCLIVRRIERLTRPALDSVSLFVGWGISYRPRDGISLVFRWGISFTCFSFNPPYWNLSRRSSSGEFVLHASRWNLSLIPTPTPRFVVGRVRSFSYTSCLEICLVVRYMGSISLLNALCWTVCSFVSWGVSPARPVLESV